MRRLRWVRLFRFFDAAGVRAKTLFASFASLTAERGAAAPGRGERRTVKALRKKASVRTVPNLPAATHRAVAENGRACYIDPVRRTELIPFYSRRKEER